MPNDPIYNKPILEVSQALKEATIAEFLATLARGAGGVHEVTATSGTEVLTAAESENGLIRATGTLTGDLTIQLLAEHVAGHRIISNETSDAHSLFVEFDGGSAAVEVSQGSIVLFIDGETILLHSQSANVAGGSNVVLGKLGAGEIADGEIRTLVLPNNVELTKVELYSCGGISGSIELDIYTEGDLASFTGNSGTSIVASAPPTISSDIASSDSTLTGWTKTFSIGTHLIFEVVSCTDIEECLVALYWNKN